MMKVNTIMIMIVMMMEMVVVMMMMVTQILKRVMCFERPMILMFVRLHEDGQSL